MEEIEKIDNSNIPLLEPVNNNNLTPSSPIIAIKKRGAKKGQLSEKTKESLAKGREKLNSKWQEDRQRKVILTEKYAIKKANKLLKEKLEIKKQMGISEDDTDDEEPIKLIQPKKPKKKQTIVLPVESDSEEEIVYKKPSKKKEVTLEQTQEIKQPLRIVFF